MGEEICQEKEKEIILNIKTTTIMKMTMKDIEMKISEEAKKFNNQKCPVDLPPKFTELFKRCLTDVPPMEHKYSSRFLKPLCTKHEGKLTLQEVQVMIKVIGMAPMSSYANTFDERFKKFEEVDNLGNLINDHVNIFKISLDKQKKNMIELAGISLNKPKLITAQA